MAIDKENFIKANTMLSCPENLPEIKLFLATEITPMWQATEDFLDKNNLAPPFWAFAWAGGKALARHILDHPELVRGKHVLDFASGSGLVAIAAARAGAKKVDTAEIDPVANDAIRLNAKENNIALSLLEYDVLDEDRENQWDIILAGDVCYEKKMSERVFNFLERSQKKGSVVLIGDPGRNYLQKEKITFLASYEIACSLELEDRDSKKVSVYQLGFSA